MSQQSKAQTFVDYAYYLAVASAGILILSFILASISDALGSTVLWGALITSISGTFMALIARTRLDQTTDPEAARRRLRISLLANGGTLLFMLIMLAIFILGTVLGQTS